MSQFLFEFIHSLSMREKAYFKRFVGIHAEDSNKNYLKIYDVVEQMKFFQKGELKNHFKGTSIEKYMSSEINYLNNKLLSSLINFHSNHSPKNKVQKGILFIEVLIAKGFRKEAMKKLNFYKKIAYRQEEFSFILKLIELEEDILFKEGILGFKDVLQKLKEERNSITAAIQNLNDLRILREEIRELQFTERFIVDGFKSHPTIYKNPILETEEHCLSIKAKAHWYYVDAIKYFLTRNYKPGIKVSEKYILFLEKYKDLFPISKLLPPISNYIYFATKVADKKSFEKGLTKLIKLSQYPQIDNTYINYIKYSRQFELARFTDDLILTKKTIDLSIQFIKSKSEQMGDVQKDYLFMLIVRAFILLKKYELAAEHLNQWIQSGVLKSSAIHSKLFSLIIHYQLNWSQLLSSEILLLKKLIKDFPREKELIITYYDFFKNELKHPKNTKSHIKELQKRLKVISKNNEQNFAFEDFNFYKWSLSLSAKNKIHK